MVRLRLLGLSVLFAASCLQASAIDFKDNLLKEYLDQKISVNVEILSSLEQGNRSAVSFSSSINFLIVPAELLGERFGCKTISSEDAVGFFATKDKKKNKGRFLKLFCAERQKNIIIFLKSGVPAENASLERLHGFLKGKEAVLGTKAPELFFCGDEAASVARLIAELNIQPKEELFEPEASDDTGSLARGGGSAVRAGASGGGGGGSRPRVLERSSAVAALVLSPVKGGGIAAPGSTPLDRMLAEANASVSARGAGASSGLLLEAVPSSAQKVSAAQAPLVAPLTIPVPPAPKPLVGKCGGFSSGASTSNGSVGAVVQSPPPLFEGDAINPAWYVRFSSDELKTAFKTAKNRLQDSTALKVLYYDYSEFQANFARLQGSSDSLHSVVLFDEAEFASFSGTYNATNRFFYIRVYERDVVDGRGGLHLSAEASMQVDFNFLFGRVLRFQPVRLGAHVPPQTPCAVTASSRFGGGSVILPAPLKTPALPPRPPRAGCKGKALRSEGDGGGGRSAPKRRREDLVAPAPAQASYDAWRDSLSARAAEKVMIVELGRSLDISVIKSLIDNDASIVVLKCTNFFSEESAAVGVFDALVASEHSGGGGSSGVRALPAVFEKARCRFVVVNDFGAKLGIAQKQPISSFIAKIEAAGGQVVFEDLSSGEPSRFEWFM